jgi:hypothetical protein
MGQERSQKRGIGPIGYKEICHALFHLLAFFCRPFFTIASGCDHFRSRRNTTQINGFALAE